MNKTYNTHRSIMTNKGFSLIEVVLAVSLFAILATALAGVFVYAQSSVVSTYEYRYATALAEQAQDVVRFVRDEDFANLAGGAYGIVNAASGWSLVPGGDLVRDRFSRAITIIETSTSTREIIAQVSWTNTSQFQQSVVRQSFLTDWQRIEAVAGTLVFDASRVRLRTRGTILRDIQIFNTGAADIQLTGLRVTWSGSAATYIEEFQLNGNPIEYECLTAPLLCPNSGDVVPFVFTLAAGDQADIRRLTFDASFAGSSFNLVFIDSAGNEYDSGPLSI